MCNFILVGMNRMVWFFKLNFVLGNDEQLTDEISFIEVQIIYKPNNKTL